MTTKCLLISILFFCLNNCVIGNIKWLAYDKYPQNMIWTKQSGCNKKYGLSHKQIKFCKTNFSWMTVTRESASATQDECRDQLKAKKWDCESITSAPKFGLDLKHDTRESAFVHALSAASLALHSSRNCLEGKLEECSCAETKPHLSFPTEIVNERNLTNIDRLLGCKDITTVGVQFAKSFLMLGFRSKPKKEIQQKQIAVRKHNINIGLKEVKGAEEIYCICNGATAGCVAKYCHRRIVQFQKIASKLKSMYENAVKANENRITYTERVSTHARHADSPSYKVENSYKNKLIYLEDGANHCSKVDGYYITTGRECYLNNKGSENCNRLCCGRGFKEKIISVEAKCNCKFIYCCRVECDTCNSVKKILECL